jgi:hypothetical protein
MASDTSRRSALQSSYRGKDVAMMHDRRWALATRRVLACAALLVASACSASNDAASGVLTARSTSLAARSASVAASPIAAMGAEQPSASDRAKERIFVSNDAVLGRSGYVGSVLVYRLGASGDAAPTNVITGSLTQLTEVEGIAVDSQGRIYVANTDTTTIVGFRRTRRAMPVRSS